MEPLKIGTVNGKPIYRSPEQSFEYANTEFVDTYTANSVTSTCIQNSNSPVDINIPNSAPGMVTGT